MPLAILTERDECVNRISLFAVQAEFYAWEAVSVSMVMRGVRMHRS